MKKAVHAMLVVSIILAVAPARNIGDAYIAKCDHIQVEAQRLGCLSEDIAKLQNFKDSLAEIDKIQSNLYVEDKEVVEETYYYLTKKDLWKYGFTAVKWLLLAQCVMFCAFAIFGNSMACMKSYH